MINMSREREKAELRAEPWILARICLGMLRKHLIPFLLLCFVK